MSEVSIESLTEGLWYAGDIRRYWSQRGPVTPQTTRHRMRAQSFIDACPVVAIVGGRKLYRASDVKVYTKGRW